MTDRRSWFKALGLGSAVSMLVEESPSEEIQAKTVHRQALPEPFLGWEAEFVSVQFPAGVHSTAHRHPGFVLGYVIDGEFRFAINGETPAVLKSGEAFYEPPGANHTVGESANAKRASRILAIIIAPANKA